MYRTELEALRSNSGASGANNSGNGAIGISALALNEAEEKCNEQKAKYEQLKEDVRVSVKSIRQSIKFQRFFQIKITLLEENRCKVMRHQINLVQRAFAAYLSGSAELLQNACNQLSTDTSQRNCETSLSNIDNNNGTFKKDVDDPMVGVETSFAFRPQHVHHQHHAAGNRRVSTDSNHSAPPASFLEN